MVILNAGEGMVKLEVISENNLAIMCHELYKNVQTSWSSNPILGHLSLENTSKIDKVLCAKLFASVFFCFFFFYSSKNLEQPKF